MVIIDRVPEIIRPILSYAVAGNEDCSGWCVPDYILVWSSAGRGLTVDQRSLPVNRVQGDGGPDTRTGRAAWNCQPDRFGVRVHAWISGMGLIFHAIPDFIHSVSGSIRIGNFREIVIAHIRLNIVGDIGNVATRVLPGNAPGRGTWTIIEIEEIKVGAGLGPVFAIWFAVGCWPQHENMRVR